MNEKEKYITRKELIQLSDMTKNCLVWYEKKGLLKPKYIGENGYHYYSLEQYFELDLIKSMKWADLSLEECREYTEKRSPESYLEILLQQQSVLDEKFKCVMYQKNIIDQTIQDFFLKRSFYTEDVRLVSQSGMYLLEETIEDSTPKGEIYAFHNLFCLFHKMHRLYGTAPSMLHGVLLSSADIAEGECNKPRKVCLKINANVPVEGCRPIPKGEFVLAFHKGQNETIGKTYRRMLAFIEEKKLKMKEEVMEFEYINYLNEKNPDNYIKEILIPVSK